MLSERHPGGKFVNEFTRPAVGHSASVFDTEWKAATGPDMKTRALYVPTTAGVLELTLTTSAKNFPAQLANLNELLGSLDARVNGKLVVRRLGGAL